jgi:hypothetical protein
VVGVAIKESSRANPTSFVNDNSVIYPMLWDEPGRLAAQLGHLPRSALPFTVLFDKWHRVAAVYVRPVTEARLSPVLDRLITEAAPTEKSPVSGR